MTYTSRHTQSLTDQEWNEMDAIRKAIKDNPASVHPEKMEKFTELLVRSWQLQDEIAPTKPWRGKNSLSE
jgi:hypothetical protein